MSEKLDEPPLSETLLGKHGRLIQIMTIGLLGLIVSSVGLVFSALILGKSHQVTGFMALVAASMYGVIFIPAFANLFYRYFTEPKSFTELLMEDSKEVE